MTSSKADRGGLTSQQAEAQIFGNCPLRAQVQRLRTPSGPAPGRAGGQERERGKGVDFVPSGSSLTKFAVIKSQSRMCVLVFWGCPAVAKKEEVRDSLGILQAAKTFSRVCQRLDERRAGLQLGTRLYWSQAPRWPCPAKSLRSPWLARVRLLSTPPPSTGARLFPPSLRAPAGHWLGHGFLRPHGGGGGAVVFRRRKGHCLEGKRHPGPRADSSRASHNLHVNLPPQRKGNR